MENKFITIKAFLVCCLFTVAVYGQQNTLGVLQYDPGSYQGYNLIIPINYGESFLIDNCGAVINSWTSAFPAGMTGYLNEDGSFVRAARVSSSFTGGGSGGLIEMFNWEGELIWSYRLNTSLIQQHHDIELLPNGNILALVWEKFTVQEALELGRLESTLDHNGLWSEKVMEIKPMGKEDAEIVWEWRVIDHIVQDIDPSKDNYGVVSEHPEKININYLIYADSSNPDWLHCNAIDYNEDLDLIIINSRNFDEFWVISRDPEHPSNGDVMYRWGNPITYNRGTEQDRKLFRQHNANWIPKGYPGEGNIMVFNNGIGRPEGAFSTVEEIELPEMVNGLYPIDDKQAYGPEEPVWSYPEDLDMDFFSSRISGANRLPNGNTLICSGRDGRVFEVDNEENVFWEFINPVNGGGPLEQGANIFGNDLFRSYRYAPDHPAFVGRILTPGPPIEIGESDPECQAFTSSVTFDVFNNIAIVPNPAYDQITITGIEGEFSFEIYGHTGNLISKSSNKEIIDISHLKSGIYVLKFNSAESQIASKRFIKM